MSLQMKWRSLWNRHLQRDLDDELDSHLEMKAEELKAEGWTAKEARLEARRRFGNVTLAKEQTREQHVFATLESLMQDVRYGLRVLLRQPAFTFTAILTLGLVIGANGAIFSLLEAVLLRPMPYPHPEQVVVLFGTDRQQHRTGIAMADLEDWRQATAFTSLAAAQTQSVNLTGVDEPTRLIGGFVSANFFSTLGVAPAVGRGFTAGEDHPGAERVCVISYGVWQDRFGADRHAIGQTMILNGEPFTVVGVLPASFRAPISPVTVWLPVQYYPNYSLDRARQSVLAVGRLAPDASLEKANAELATISGRLAMQYPDSNRDRGGLAITLHEMMVGNLRPTILLLAGAVGCVLLIGCANIAALLLTKAAGRRQELAIRVSLGAGAGRVMRQLLTESLLLAVAGGALGILLAYGGVQLMAAYPDGLPRDTEVGINLPVLMFLIAVSLLTGLLFGLAPAMMARREAANQLRQRGAASGQGRMRNVLVAVQVSLALVLLVGAGLMTKSIARLTGVDPGFRSDHTLTMEYRLPRTKYPAPAQQVQFHNEVVSRVNATPGVVSASIVRGLPFSGNSGTTNITLPDRPEPPRESPFTVSYNAASPAYFQTAGIPLLEGRDFSPNDALASARVAVVSRSFEQRFWPGKSALGREVRIPVQDAVQGNGATTIASIVGVVGDVKEDALDDIPLPEMYVANAQDPFIFATLVVRTKGEPLAMTKAVQRAIWSIDKDQPMWKIRTMEYLVERSTGNRKLLRILLGCFSSLALVLAAVGLYGVLAFGVSQRTAEFGIRMALGAPPVQVMALVLRNGLKLLAAGLGVGLCVSLLLSRYIHSQLYEVSATDPAIYAGISLLLCAVVLVAASLPARRAMQVDPVVALRHD